MRNLIVRTLTGVIYVLLLVGCTIYHPVTAFFFFAAVAAFFLHWIINQIVQLLTSHFNRTGANWLYLVYPVVGIYLTSLFVRYIVKDNISHGITRILYAISSNKSRLKSHNCWSSVIASAITIGFGGSVGAEAPIVLTSVSPTRSTSPSTWQRIRCSAWPRVRVWP